LDAQQNSETFLVSPYLQIGASPSSKSLVLLWQLTENKSEWTVEYKSATEKNWNKGSLPLASFVNVAGIPPHYVYRSTLDALVPGGNFTYRVNKNGNTIFSSDAIAPKTTTQAQKFVVFGDIGAGTKEAKEIAEGVYKTKADLILVPGDIVYDYGTIPEYNIRFWPIYNSNSSAGFPIMQSVPFVAAVGNHDADSRDLDKAPGALAYFHYWDQPLNGPVGKEGGAYVPLLKGSDSNRNAFLEAAGNRYPRMTNFSFNYGNAHWTILDADTYVDWTDKELTDWVAKDLSDSKNMTWHFVLYHHPGFNASIEHYEQQQMRLLSPVFEKGGVDIVFNGHVHNYQRSFPMTFKPVGKGTLLVGGKDNKTIRGRVVSGAWKLDHQYDGVSNTKPNGVIYIVTGAGGQDLYNREQEKDKDSWQPFTDKFISTVHSFTIATLKENTLIVQQVDAKGKILDEFKIIK
jgi:predicted phosphodiesterase